MGPKYKAQRAFCNSNFACASLELSELSVSHNSFVGTNGGHCVEIVACLCRVCL